MNFKWFLDVIKNHYVDFSGRTSKKDFWMYVLHYVVIIMVLGIIDSILGLNTSGLKSLLALVCCLPSLAIGARRLQDTGRSPLWLLITLTCIGFFVLIFFWAQDSQEGSNEYGEKPVDTI